MTDAGHELIDAIHATAELEFWGVPEALYLTRVPLTIWRYAPKPENRVRIETISELITLALCNRRLSWELRPPAKNWVLAPQRFHLIEDSGRFRQYPEIVNYLEESEPELGRAAHADLLDITRDVIRSLGSWQDAARH